MLRITRQPDDNGFTILALEGRLTADFVAVLEQAIAAAGSPLSRLVLDMDDLSYVDQTGVAALRELLGRGVGIARSPAWLRLLLAQSPSSG